MILHGMLVHSMGIINIYIYIYYTLPFSHLLCSAWPFFVGLHVNTTGFLVLGFLVHVNHQLILDEN